MAFKGTYARQLAPMPPKITETLSIMQSFFSPNWFLAGKYLNFLHLHNSIFSQQLTQFRRKKIKLLGRILAKMRQSSC